MSDFVKELADELMEPENTADTAASASEAAADTAARASEAAADTAAASEAAADTAALGSGDFRTVMLEFINQLVETFPEITSRLEDIRAEICDSVTVESTSLYEHCRKEYPKYFFEIIYKNDELFSKEIFLLPDIDFSKLWSCNLTEGTRDNLWKFIQYISFLVVKQAGNGDIFGEALNVLETLDSGDVKSKINEIVAQLENTFGNIKETSKPESESKSLEGLASGLGLEGLEELASSLGLGAGLEELVSGAGLGGLGAGLGGLGGLGGLEELASGLGAGLGAGLDELGSGSGGVGGKDWGNNIYSQMSGFMNGKLGKIAKEIADETSTSLLGDFDDIDVNDETDIPAALNKIFTRLKGNPDTVLNIMQNLGNKINTKIEEDKLTKNDIIEETGELMKNFENLSEYKNMFENMPFLKDMMSNMTGAGGAAGADAKNKSKQSSENVKARNNMKETLKKRNMENQAKDLIRKMQEDMMKQNESATSTVVPDNELDNLVNFIEGGDKKKKNKKKKKKKNKKKEL
jgi:hypothetical protein